MPLAKPIMVTFGTNQGSITPLYTTTPPPKTIVQRSPAPIYETPDDLPNPNTYRPPVPHQYRTKIYSFKPNPNLILGTPIDQKYTPALEKYEIYRKQLAKSIGRDYKGPQFFERQAYEFEPRKLFKPVRQYYQQQPTQQQNQQGQYVPEIGVVFSSGVRYYVPQIPYYGENEVSENSVYDENDTKHVYYSRRV